MARQHVRLAATAALLAGLVASGAQAQYEPDPCSNYTASPPDPNSVEGQNELQRQQELKRQCELDQQQKRYQDENYKQTVDQIHRYGELSRAQNEAQSRQSLRAPRSTQTTQSGIGRSPQNQVLPYGTKSSGDRQADQLTARGDYAGAVSVWRPLAERGDINAQYALGIMYQLGRGVPQSNAQSAMWYRRAADRGYGAAMVNLAWIMVQGATNPAQLIPAYTWVRIAEERDSDPGVLKNARYDMSLLTSHMTAEQVSRAEAAAQVWRPH